MSAIDTLVLHSLGDALRVSALVAAFFTLLLLAKSLRDFSRTGPQMAGEVLSHYRFYLVYSLARLSLHTFLITCAMAFLGALIYVAGLVLTQGAYDALMAVIAALLGIGVLTGRQFLRTLLYSPGVLASSSHYSMTRFYPLWERLTPARLRGLDLLLGGALITWLASSSFMLAQDGGGLAAVVIAFIVAAYAAVMWLATRRREPPAVAKTKKQKAPNILLIGSDTLRADRLNGMGYPRELTPTLEALAKRASRFTDCYVPCARTAPSLVSLLTGTWPHSHKVRDTFVTPAETELPIAALPEILSQQGYHTAAVGDWAISDVSKFDFGFERTDMPHDQWNIKYLLRQGPKDIRLFLSLFTQNDFGKRFLPEVYYLGGHPLTEEVGRDTRQMIAALAQEEEPFFLLSFMATTHPPFTSKYPYYAMYADPGYRGESKFAMAKLRDPFEIIRRQGEPKTEFDLDQIINLYDGCVRNFDDELKRILDYLDESGLADNTIVGIFSDHGMEFFEHETWGQGNSAIGDFSARVPLIIADPRNPQAGTISNVVRTVDIAPTLLQMIGQPQPGYMEGVSLLPLMNGTVGKSVGAPSGANSGADRRHGFAAKAAPTGDGGVVGAASGANSAADRSHDFAAKAAPTDAKYPIDDNYAYLAELPAFYETGVWLTDLPGTPDGHLRYPSLPELLEVPDKNLGMISLKPEYQAIIIAAKDRMVRLGEWKLTYQPLTKGALFQLFNIRDDAACRYNVIEQHPHIARKLKALLAEWMDDDNYPHNIGDEIDDHQSQGTT